MPVLALSSRLLSFNWHDALGMFAATSVAEVVTKGLRVFSTSTKTPALRPEPDALLPERALVAPADPLEDAERELRVWVAAASRGGREAAEELLRALLPRVRNLVRYFVRGDAEVDDLAQEALVTILRGLAGYRGEGNVRAWADRIVVRTVFAQLRRTRAAHKVHVEYEAESVHVASNESAQRFLARRQAMRALDTLPDEQRDVLVMHHVLGLSVREIAQELGAPFETVRSRMRLGMARLRQALGSDAVVGEDLDGGEP